MEAKIPFLPPSSQNYLTSPLRTVSVHPKKFISKQLNGVKCSKKPQHDIAI